MYGWGRDDDESLGATPPPAMSAVAALMTSPPQQQGQWGQEETKELIKIRADMERDSAASSVRSKAMWDAVSSEMLRRGFARTPDQCKCKWKNLLNRYKGKETSDPSTGRQCPFFDELHALFAERAKNMSRLLMEAEEGSPRSARKRGKRSKNEISEENGDNSEEEENAARKRTGAGVGGMLEEFLGQVVRAERRREEAEERRARERMSFESEWREWMERAERERLERDRLWREKEEERKLRQETWDVRRDELLTALLNSLIDDHRDA